MVGLSATTIQADTSTARTIAITSAVRYWAVAVYSTTNDTATRKGWASSHALHAAESHTLARSAAAAAVAATTYQPHADNVSGRHAIATDPITLSSTEPAMNPVWCASLIRTRRGRSSSTRDDGADGVGSPGAGMTGSGNRAHSADNCGASTVTSSATTTRPAPSVTNGSCHSVLAAAASSTPPPSTAVAVKKLMAPLLSRCGRIRAISDQAVTPAAASVTCAVPKLPGTARAKAAAIGTNAAAEIAAPARGDRVARPASTVSSAIPPTTNDPTTEPVA